jgi:hypothetical protein
MLVISKCKAFSFHKVRGISWPLAWLTASQVVALYTDPWECCNDRFLWPPRSPDHIHADFWTGIWRAYVTRTWDNMHSELCLFNCSGKNKDGWNISAYHEFWASQDSIIRSNQPYANSATFDILPTLICRCIETWYIISLLKYVI